MTASFSLVMPDLRAVSDEDLESLLPQADGAWSRQTKALMLSLGAQKLNLNSNWAEVRRDWVCEACQRRKAAGAGAQQHRHQQGRDHHAGQVRNRRTTERRRHIAPRDRGKGDRLLHRRRQEADEHQAGGQTVVQRTPCQGHDPEADQGKDDEGRGEDQTL